MNEIKYLLANFIDEFNRSNSEQKSEMVKSFPFDTNELKDNKHSAYVAAMVEELCFTNNIKIPDWVFDKKYNLKEPFFTGGLESLKAFLIVESPLPFRRRNIFVSENALHRA